MFSSGRHGSGGYLPFCRVAGTQCALEQGDLPAVVGVVLSQPMQHHVDANPAPEGRIMGSASDSLLESLGREAFQRLVESLGCALQCLA